ncbi:FeoA family protein [Sphingobacterium sp. Mn56C]|uniref:FeoA family protein n=1 Tax=Sphingobacterium sp. Mn56C TaxID=3395261 RepID=UPI003BBE16CD
MQNKISIDKLNRGERATIDSFMDERLPAKFYELGFTPGATIEIKHKAPLHGPICIQIIQNNTLIAIRKTEALLILANKL